VSNEVQIVWFERGGVLCVAERETSRAKMKVCDCLVNNFVSINQF